MFDVQPRTGPRSGGTRLVVTGSHLDTGSNATVTVAGLACRVTARHAGVACVTSPAPEGTDASQVSVMVDAANRTLSVPFAYVDGKMTQTTRCWC